MNIANHDRPRPARGLLACTLIALGALLSVSCSSDDPITTFQFSCLVLAPAPPSGTATVEVRTGDESSCSFLDVDLVVSGVSDVLGARFTLNYPFTFVRLDGIEFEESFLTSDGTSLITHVEDETIPDGVAAITITRQAITGATPVPDTDDLLIRLKFTQTAAVGSGSLSFTVNSLESPGTPPVTISDVEWFGGDLRIQ